MVSKCDRKIAGLNQEIQELLKEYEDIEKTKLEKAIARNREQLERLNQDFEQLYGKKDEPAFEQTALLHIYRNIQRKKRVVAEFRQKLEGLKN